MDSSVVTSGGEVPTAGVAAGVMTTSGNEAEGGVGVGVREDEGISGEGPAGVWSEGKGGGGAGVGVEGTAALAADIAAALSGAVLPVRVAGGGAEANFCLGLPGDGEIGGKSLDERSGGPLPINEAGGGLAKGAEVLALGAPGALVACAGGSLVD